MDPGLGQLRLDPTPTPRAALNLTISPTPRASQALSKTVAPGPCPQAGSML